MNFLARYNSSPTWRYYNEIEYIFRHVRGTIVMSLFYQKNTNHELTRCVNT